MSLSTDFDYSGYDGNSDGGVTNDTQPLTPPPDPSGGTGAIDPSYLSTATNGISASLGQGVANQIGSLIGLAAVNVTGALVYKATAGANAYAGYVAPSAPVTPRSNTLLLVGAAALVLILLATRK